MLRVEMIVSRAAKDEIKPMPIFQSKPSGAIAGSIRRPARPAKLLSICIALSLWGRDGVGVCGACNSLTPSRSPRGKGADRGKAVNAQSKIEIDRITVPARFRKTEERVNRACATFPKSGSRYGGSSITNGGGGAFRIVRFKIDATMIATATPSKYIVRMITAPSDTTPNTVFPEKNAAIIKV